MHVHVHVHDARLALHNALPILAAISGHLSTRTGITRKAHPLFLSPKPLASLTKRQLAAPSPQ